MRRLPPALLLTVAVVAVLGMARHEPQAPQTAPDAAAPSAERGHALVQRDCASCHAVEAAGDSDFGPAPPFRTLHEKYPLEALEEALAEGILSGHPAMPEYEYAPDQIADIIAWMKSLDAE